LSYRSSMHLEFFYLHQKRAPCDKPTYFWKCILIRYLKIKNI
jgi:hypothetical protein